MSLSAEAQILYGHLVRSVVPTKKVTTYGDVSNATAIPIGEGGGHIGRVLGEVARACHARGLPPLSSIVVLADGVYDRARRHGMPGVGYFTMQAEFDEAFADWGKKPAPPGFDRDTDRWRLQSVVEANQDAVWARRVWPERL